MIIVKQEIRTDHVCSNCGNGITSVLDSTKTDKRAIICDKCFNIVHIYD